MAGLGRYHLRERLGAGGMGEVFLAVTVGAAGFEKKVVIKRLLPLHAADEAARTLFLGEALLLTKLAHPNVVGVIDFGVGEREDYFLVLEHVDGVDLEKLLRVVERRGERVSERMALRVAGQVLRALAFAHELADREGKTLVHRDVTPANVLLSKAGEVKLADFGVTLFADAGAGGDGAFAGKPAWMSPEQLARGPIDARSDLFSVGVLLHRMIAGGLPFVGEDRDEPAPLEASPEVQAIVARALARDPAARFARAREMLGAIEALPGATGDELGELVVGVLAEAPTKGEEVVVLRAPKGGEDLRGTELTLQRTSHGAEPKAERVEGPIAVAPTPRSPVRWPFVVLGIGVVSLVGWTIWPGARAGGVGGAPASASVPVPVPVPDPATATASATVAASVAPGASTSASATRLPGAMPSVRVTASGSGSAAAPSPDCRGTVWIRADHAWSVRAGTLSAEAPDRVTWPCGTYEVVATSKLDPPVTRTVRVTVSPTATATLDLRAQ